MVVVVLGNGDNSATGSIFRATEFDTSEAARPCLLFARAGCNEWRVSLIIVVCVVVKARDRVGHFNVWDSFDLISHAIRYHHMSR